MMSFQTVAIYFQFEFESLVCPTFTAVTKAHLELVSVYLNITAVSFCCMPTLRCTDIIKQD